MKRYSKLILFVHGLGGSKSTWGKFDELVAADTELAWDVAHFVYPSPFLGIRLIPLLQSTYQPIQVLADALRTTIEERYQDYEEIALIGHSLGGLVIRKYVLTEVQTRRDLRVQKVVLYAVPNDGSSLAAISRELSIWDNAHVKQLCKKSEFLESLRVDWARAEVGADVDFTVVVGGNDRIVTLASAEGNFRSRDLEPKIIPEAGHRNISKPKGADDLRYIILRNALKKKRSITQGRLSGSRLVSEWGKYKAASSFPFQLDEKRDAHLRALTSHFSKAKKTIRVVGLSGLGKTRLVYEAARIAESINPHILYYDAAQETTQLLDWTRKAVAIGKEGTLIVDNCSVSLHGKLQDEIERVDSNICLITIDYSLETTGSTTIRVERFGDEVIDAMLSPIYKGHIDEYELRKIVQFAQGFPQLAVMLADARLVDDGNLGNLNNDLIARKLLWGNDEPSSEIEKILQGCALFEHFGVDGEVSRELKFIADTVIGVDEDDCYECIQRFTEKGLIDRRGRYAQLVPKPLAIRLASQWWRRTKRERQINLISNLPEVMEGSFCAQIARLDFLPEVKDLTEELCGVQGPFGRAEVILSRRGSALFRALVEVNPGATSSVIERVLALLSIEELAKIQGETRRNLVWALEKLSVRSETFRRAAFSLLRLASAENETWSNNATGIFRQLFRVHLSGTAAPPADRFEFVRNMLATKDERYADLIAQALESALDLNSGVRTVGAEYQGSAPPIAEWRPAVWQEIFDYFEQSIEIITDIFDGFPNLRALVQQIVGKSIRNLVWNGRIEALDSTIRHIVEKCGHHWPQALESVKDCIAYDQERIPQEGKDALQRWELLLGGTTGTLEEKIKILVLDPPFEHRDLDTGEFVDIARVNAVTFAKELAVDPERTLLVIPMLMQNSAHRQTFAFAKALAENLENPASFIGKVIEELAQDHDKADVLLRGFLHGIFIKSHQSWKKIIDELETNGKLDHLYPQIVCTGDVTIERLMHAKGLVECVRTPLFSLRVFSYGGALRDVSAEDCAMFVESVLQIDDSDAPWIALDILFMYCYGEPGRREAALNSFAKIVIACDVKPSNNIRDMHQWSTVCGWLLESRGAELAALLVEKLITAIIDKDVRMDTRDIVGKAVRRSIELHPLQTWLPLERAIMASSGISRLNLLWLFESKRSFSSDNRPSLMDTVPIELLIDWCRRAPDMAPQFIARTINPFVVVDGALKLNDLVAVLLDEFEDSEGSVGSALSANLGTRSWSGSLVPLLERDKAAITPLLSHHSRAVSTWAIQRIAALEAEISRERVRDEEQDLR